MTYLQCSTLFHGSPRHHTVSSSIVYRLRFARQLSNRPKMNRNYYDILGVSPNSTEKDIKSVYYSLVKKHHPDSINSTSNSAKFLDIKEAYDVLRNVDKRRQYDAEMQKYSETTTNIPRYRTTESKSTTEPKTNSAYDDFMRPMWMRMNQQTAKNNNQSSGAAKFYEQRRRAYDEPGLLFRVFVIYMAFTTSFLMALSFRRPNESRKRDRRWYHRR